MNNMKVFTAALMVTGILATDAAHATAIFSAVAASKGHSIRTSDPMHGCDRFVYVRDDLFRCVLDLS